MLVQITCTHIGILPTHDPAVNIDPGDMIAADAGQRGLMEEKETTGRRSTLEKLDLNGQPLNLDFTMTCGQAFRWRKLADGAWSGVVRDKLLELTMEGESLLWRTYPEYDQALVVDYLRLGDDVSSIYSELSDSDPYLAQQIGRFHGLRLLRQDPYETLLSFICSAANSIPRIMKAIEALSARYGKLVCEKEGLCYYAFPSAQQFAEAEKQDLEQTESLHFRGANLKTVAQQVRDRGEGWLISLRNATYIEAKADLMTVRGVGAKIADCVCLFSLDKDEAVPVDTHVKQLAQRLFLPEIQAKSITDAVYRRVVTAFEERYGKYAGWAQQFLYYDDLLRSRAARGGTEVR